MLTITFLYIIFITSVSVLLPIYVCSLLLQHSITCFYTCTRTVRR